MSAIEWTAEVADTGRVKLRLDKLPFRIRQRLKVTITQLTNELLSRVLAAEPVRTGALRAATRASVDEGISRSGPWVRGRVRVSRESKLGARFGALEYGGPGMKNFGQPVEVKPYVRKGVRVAGYNRKQPRIRARRYLRGPAMAQRARALAALEAALKDAIAIGE